jgi:transitional endoplasmic reticulum ATPase
MLAKAVATESSMNFIAVKGPELLSKWVGDSEKALKEVFRKARVSAPTVVFFDEIDSIGTSRGEDCGNSASSRVLSQLLQEMDGIAAAAQVVVIGATNVIDSLDRALIRPGRFDQCLYIGPPDLDARKEILKLELKKITSTVEDHDIEVLAGLLEGSTGADITAVVREAAMLAVEQDLDHLESKHLHQAIQQKK